MDVAALRKLFPVTETLAYLNNAAESPVNLRFRRRLDEYLDLVSRAPHEKPSVRDETRALLARLLGGKPSEYALVASTGVGVGITAAGIDWKPGDNVVVPADEHWNNTFPWFALRDKGVETRLVPADPDGRVEPAAFAKLVDGRTRVVAVAAVRHTTGFRADLEAIGAITHERGAIFAVDGIQAAGVMPLNVDAAGIDVLSAAGFKWLLGQPGIGFYYVRESVRDRIKPVLPGMFAAEDDLRELRLFPDSRRYETGTIAYPFFHAWAGGLELLLELGVDAIHARVLALAARAAEGIASAGLTLASPTERESERSAILSFTAGTQEENKAIIRRLQDDRILVSLRGGRVRVSPSFFNTEDEIDQFVAALRAR